MKGLKFAIVFAIYVFVGVFEALDIDIPGGSHQLKPQFTNDTLPPWIRIMPADSLPDIEWQLAWDSAYNKHEYTVLADSLGTAATKEDSCWIINDCERSLEIMLKAHKDVSKELSDLRTEYMELQREIQRQSSQPIYANLKN